MVASDSGVRGLMRCTSGHENPAGVSFCMACGLAMPSTPPPIPPSSPSYPSSAPAWPSPVTSPTTVSPFGVPAPPRNGMGMAALVLGLCSIACGWVLGLLAIIFGAIGIARANRGEATNKGQATAGLVLGIVFFTLWLLWGISQL